MSRSRIQMVSHLASSELIRLYEECEDLRTKNHWLVIQLLSRVDDPMTIKQVADSLGFSEDWVRKLARRYNRMGPAGILHKKP